MCDPVEDAITMHHAIQERQLTCYRQAQDEHKPCSRCDEWKRLGLSSTCPTCDELILNRMQELEQEYDG